jgi:hypothetical protein
MGGGGGKGGMQQSETLERNNEILFNESSPVRRELLDQTLEAMLTGGVGAQVPIIQRSVEASNAALGQSLRGLDERIAATPGLAGTPGAEGVRSALQLQGEQSSAAIPPQIAAGLISGAPNLALGFPQVSNQGLEASGSLANEAKGQQLGAITGIVGGLAGAAGCHVAELLYGETHPRAFWARRYVQTTDNWLTRMYSRNSVRWAAWLKRNSWAQPFVRPVFRWMSNRGRTRI